MKHYKIETTRTFDKEFKKLNTNIQKIILKFIKENLDKTENPYKKGKPLKGNFAGIWRYRILDYRLLVDIKEDKLIIKALRIAHRNKIYK